MLMSDREILFQGFSDSRMQTFLDLGVEERYPVRGLILKEGEGGSDIVIGMGGSDVVNGGGSVDLLAGGSGSGADLGDAVLEPDEADEFFTITPPDWVLSTF